MQTETQPYVIRDFNALSYEEKHVLARKALVHKTPEMQVNVYEVEAGGKIPEHHHTSSWDISIITEGEIEARYFVDDEQIVEKCAVGSITIVPPGSKHEVFNPSQTSRAVFILIQSPSDGFDFVKHP